MVAKGKNINRLNFIFYYYYSLDNDKTVSNEFFNIFKFLISK